MLFKMDVPIYSPVNLSEEAERQLINNIISESYFATPKVQRLLASYVSAEPFEKDEIILKLMKTYWDIPVAAGLFKTFRDFDVAFSLLGKKGHFIHQFEVFLLGTNIILQIINARPDSPILDHFANKEQLLYTWLLTSTAHDLGYSFQVAHKLCAHLSGMYDALRMKNLAEEFRQITKRSKKALGPDLLNTEISAKGGKKTNFSFEEFLIDGIATSLSIGAGEASRLMKLLKGKNDHGYISAILLCKNYLGCIEDTELTNKPGEEWRMDCLHLAATAISLHTLKTKQEEYIRQFNSSNPIAILLFIVDNLQEWQRMLRPHALYPAYNLYEFNIVEKYICFKYILTHEKWTNRMCTEVTKYLNEKQQILNYIADAWLNLSDLRFKVFFESNSGSILTEFTFPEHV